MRNRNREEIARYSTDQLQALYHQAENEPYVRLRDGIVTRDEVAAEISWRLHREKSREGWRYWLLAVLTFVAAISAVASVYLAWR